MNMDYSTRLDAHGVSYIAKLAERDGWCREIVFANGEQIHYAEFSACNLGSAKRGDYLEAMANSIAYRHKRKSA